MEGQKIRVKWLQNGYKIVKKILYHQKLPFILKALQIKLICRHHNNSLASYFGINKIRELIGHKYYWLSSKKDVKVYVKGCIIYLSLKTIWQKSYNNLQLLPILTYWLDNLLINFITRLLILTNWKEENYNSILVIINWFIKMIYYKQIKVTINIPILAKFIFNIVV